MTTLSQPDPVPLPEALGALPRLPRDEGGPVFAEPWQAQAFALAVKLSESVGQGSLRKIGKSGPQHSPKNSIPIRAPTMPLIIYEHWLATLERLVTAKGLSNPAAMLARKEAWAEAYRHTPHGKPVELKAFDK